MIRFVFTTLFALTLGLPTWARANDNLRTSGEAQTSAEHSALAKKLRLDAAEKRGEATRYRQLAERPETNALAIKHPNSPGSRGHSSWLAGKLERQAERAEAEAAQHARLAGEPETLAASSAENCCSSTRCSDGCCDRGCCGDGMLWRML